MDFLHKVEAIIILDHEGTRVFTKYFPRLDASAAKRDSVEAPMVAWGTADQQRAFEALLHAKARDPRRSPLALADFDISHVEGRTVIFQTDAELTLAVAGSGEENEMVLCAVLQCLTESLQQLLKTSQLSKRHLLEKYDVLLLVVDEMLDDGVILETSATNVAAEVAPFDVETPSDNARKAIGGLARLLKGSM